MDDDFNSGAAIAALFDLVRTLNELRGIEYPQDPAIAARIASRGGSYSCASECDFDLCVKCTRCDNGHQMQVHRGNPYSHMGPFTSARCNRCQQMIPAQQMNSGFLRCPVCQFDVCRSCIPEPR